MKQVAKPAAKKAAATAITSATGIPTPVVERAMKYWKPILAVCVVALSLPTLVFVGFLTSLVGGGSSASACAAPTSTASITTTFAGPSGQSSSFAALRSGDVVTVTGTQSLNVLEATSVTLGSSTPASATYSTSTSVVHGTILTLDATAQSFVVATSTGADVTVDVEGTSAQAGTPPPASELATFLAALRWQESRDNYSDATAGATWDPAYDGVWNDDTGSGAFGAYQWQEQSWYAEAADAGFTQYELVNPATLPANVSASVQDAVATKKVTEIYQNAEATNYPGPIWQWVAEAWYDPADANPADQNLAPGGPTMQAYGSSVVNYMTTMPWTTTSTTLAGANPSATLISTSSGACPTEVSGPLASRIVQVATSTLGETQQNGGWGPAGEPWCAYYASWVLQTAGVDPSPPTLAYSGDLWKWAGSNGGIQLSPTATPSPGDLVFFENFGYDLASGYAQSAHVAIVTQVEQNGDIVVIGGNEGLDNNSFSTVNKSLPFNPADAAADGWPGPIWAYAQPPGL